MFQVCSGQSQVVWRRNAVHEEQKLAPNVAIKTKIAIKK